MNRFIRSATIFAAISPALLGPRPASAQLTLYSGAGPATLATNNFGPTTAQVLPGYQVTYGGGATSGFAFQPGQANAAVNILVAYNADGSSGVYLDTLVPRYEGQDDSTVGVVNHSNSLITSMILNAPNSDLAGFDNDGADAVSAGGAGETTIVGPVPPGVARTGYEGPTSWFIYDKNQPDTLTINFATPIPVGGSTFFFVENSPQPIVNGLGGSGGGVGVGTMNPVPEPSSVFLMTACMVSLFGFFRARRPS